MCARWIFIALACLVAHADLAKGAGLVFALPKDGSWATYEGILSRNADAQALAPKVNATVKTTVYVASVGAATISNQRCRWIELQFDLSVPVDDQAGKEKTTFRLLQSQTCKALIPEQYLVSDASPLEHVVRAWIRLDNNEPMEIKQRKELDDTALGAFLKEPWLEKHVKRVEKMDVESRLGKVACEGVEFTAAAPDDPTKRGKVLFRLHPRSPFGVVSANWTLGGPGETFNWSLKLIDCGERATSKMPNYQ